jgi:hypothetical protein
LTIIKEKLDSIRGEAHCQGVQEEKPMIESFKRVYVRHYRDNNQTKLYVEWLDTRGRSGRTEGEPDLQNSHMAALVRAAVRQGLRIEREVW